MYHCKHKATQNILNALKAAGYGRSIVREMEDGRENIEISFGVNNGPLLSIDFFIPEKINQGVSMRVFGFINNVSDEKRSAVLEACNTLNCSYRYIRFGLDRDNDVNLYYDFSSEAGENIGAIVVDIVKITISLVDLAAYPMLAKVLHGGEAAYEEPNAILQGALQRFLRKRGIEVPDDIAPDDILPWLHTMYADAEASDSEQ